MTLMPSRARFLKPSAFCTSHATIRRSSGHQPALSRVMAMTHPLPSVGAVHCLDTQAWDEIRQDHGFF